MSLNKSKDSLLKLKLKETEWGLVSILSILFLYWDIIILRGILQDDQVPQKHNKETSMNEVRVGCREQTFRAFRY